MYHALPSIVGQAHARPNYSRGCFPVFYKLTALDNADGVQNF